jgi:acyl phosphate:glycerol-3-phosphate acyltransferase
MDGWLFPVLALVAGYALGSIPFGIILTRIGGAGDLRSVGSGNIGATNVLRTGRKGLAAAPLARSSSKVAAAVWVAGQLGEGLGPAGGAAAVIGHIWPVWLGFKGGKGVATLMGVTLALSWVLGLVYALVWIGAIAVTRISSLGGMAAAIVTPIAATLTGRMDLAFLLLGLGLIVVWMHRENIGRLIEGQEPRIGQSKA